MRGVGGQAEWNGSGGGEALESKITDWDIVAVDPNNTVGQPVDTKGHADARNLAPDDIDPRQAIADKLRGLGHEINSEHWDKLTGKTLQNLIWNLTGVSIGEGDVALIDDWRRSRSSQERRHD